MKTDQKHSPQEARQGVADPVARHDDLTEVLARLQPIEDEFPEIADPPSRPEDPL